MTHMDADDELTLRAAEPAVASQSSVPLLRQNGTYAELIGSATLFAVADQLFLVTAAHVIRNALGMEAGLGAINAAGRATAVSGEWRCSPLATQEDIAVYPLTADQAIFLSDRKAARTLNYRLDAERGAVCFIIFGFPQIGGEGAGVDTKQAVLTQLRLRVGRFAGDGAALALANFDQKYHFLLNADETQMPAINNYGSLRSLSGIRVPLVQGLRGVSGGGVWSLGDENLSLGAWRPDQACIVGVETSVYEGVKAIRVTRWNRVLELIAGAYPDLRGALRLSGV